MSRPDARARWLGAVALAGAASKTINKYLGKDFTVTASMGHVRDLPKNPKKKGKKILGGVDVGRGFTVDNEVLPTRKKVVEEIKSAALKAEAIFLAADPDREGEAICWHLAEELGPKARKKLKRVVFNEITKKAIEQAFQQPRAVDEKKVDAQQARRILDRLVGYGVSPILWDKVRRGLSAGRVQSVALRLICERERAIRAFVAEEYWTVAAQLAGWQPPAIVATLARKDGHSRDDLVQIAPQNRIYFRDIYDHLVRLHDLSESVRDVITGALDTYLSVASNRLSEVMKALTIVSTIFLPLSFLASVFGMNFDYFPGLHWQYGYYVVWGLFIAIAVGMLWYFRRRGWI